MKSEDLVPKILEAVTKSDAIEIMKDFLRALNFSNEYLEISRVANDLEEARADFKVLSDALEDCRGNIEKLIDLRIKLNFFHRDVGDMFKFKAHRWKTFYQEVKTQRRAEAIANIKNNKEVLDKLGIKSATTSAIRDVMGADEEYQEFIRTLALAEGLQKSVDSFLEVILQFSHTVASLMNYEKNVEMKDQK